jgi:hypothetical protein
MLTLGCDHAAHLVRSPWAGILLEPRDKGSDGESLGNSAVFRTSSSSGSRSSDLSNLGGSGLGGGCSRLGGRRGGNGLGGVARGGGGRRSRARSTTHLEIDARLVRLVDGWGIPPPLDNTVASIGALGANIGHGNVELGPFGVAGDGHRSQGVLVEADEGLANNLVGADFDNGDVGVTIVWSANLNLHGNLLAGSVVEDLTGIFEGNTLALPDAAVWVGALEVLHGALDIAKLVRRLLVKDLITAGGLETRAGLTGSRRLNEAVGGNGRGKASQGNGGRERLHSDCCSLVCVWERKVPSECNGSLAS